MKVLIACALLAAVSCSTVELFTQFDPAKGKSLDEYWEHYKVEHGKKYETVEEEQKRKETFGKSVKFVQMHNYLYSIGKKSFHVAINKFSDMETEEFAKIMNGYKPNNKTSSSRDRATFLPPLSMEDVPSSVDWRPKGYVTPIKNQGECGSCWAFSATGALEGQHFRKYKKLVSLSEQQLVDCSTKWGNEGCDGGLPDQAFQYIKDNKGIDTEQSYPYKAEDESGCYFKKSTIGADDVGYVDITPRGSEEALAVAVATMGPISIAIDASSMAFQSYKGGVFYNPECSPEDLDHAVLIVGYGVEEGQAYWMVKNSWGTDWGDDGYIKMSKDRNNNCGVATQAAYPLV